MSDDFQSRVTAAMATRKSFSVPYCAAHGVTQAKFLRGSNDA
jgi:hypothetical protein